MTTTVRYTTINGEVIAEKRNGVRKEYVPDPLGSTVALLDNTQTQTDTFSYWPYGEVNTRTGTTPTPFQFVGTLGYYVNTGSRAYVRARELDSQKGRWITEDPVGFDGGDWNLLRYVENSPQSALDPTGLETNRKKPKGFMCPKGYNSVWITGYGDNTGKVEDPITHKTRENQKYDCAVGKSPAVPVCKYGSYVHIVNRGKTLSPIELCMVCDTGPAVGHVKEKDPHTGKSHERKFPQIDIYIGGSNSMSDATQDAGLIARNYALGGAWYCYKCFPRTQPKSNKPKPV